MKILFAILLLSSWAHAATDTRSSAPSTKSRYGSEIKQQTNEKKKTPSAVPCPPQKTRDEQLEDLAKLEGAGEPHSSNCPAAGAIKDVPDSDVR